MIATARPLSACETVQGKRNFDGLTTHSKCPTERFQNAWDVKQQKRAHTVAASTASVKTGNCTIMYVCNLNKINTHTQVGS
jgi:hypothetical protein